MFLTIKRSICLEFTVNICVCFFNSLLINFCNFTVEISTHRLTKTQGIKEPLVFVYITAIFIYYRKVNHVNSSKFAIQVNNYIRLHVCLSFHAFNCVSALFTLYNLIKNVINKSSLVGVKSEKYAVWVTLRLPGSMRQGKAELCTIHYQARQSQAAYIFQNSLCCFITSTVLVQSSCVLQHTLVVPLK